MRNSIGLVLGSLLVGLSPAHALTQSMHYQISFDACRNAGGPTTFCQQVGVAAHDVDRYEFNDMAAHSQMANGQTACDGANHAIWRVFWFGQQIRIAAQMAAIYADHQRISRLAQYVGRALHTVQDNCAHSGMPNPQHAWKSVSDFCDGTHDSPDEKPAAIECARWETGAVMNAVFEVLVDNGAEKSRLNDVQYRHRGLTPYADACNYLGSADLWNGVDRRWDNEIVRPFMRNEIVQAITSDNAHHEYVCYSTSEPLLVSYDSDVDVSDGPPSCFAIHAFCLGKADEVGAPEAEASTEAGCGVAGPASPASGSLALLLLGVTALLWRRRRYKIADQRGANAKAA